MGVWYGGRVGGPNVTVSGVAEYVLELGGKQICCWSIKQYIQDGGAGYICQKNKIIPYFGQQYLFHNLDNIYINKSQIFSCLWATNF